MRYTQLHYEKESALSHLPINEIVTFNQYQEAVQETAIYHTIGHPIVYPVLGLNGETGEVAEKVKKFVRDLNFKMTPEWKSLLKKELGDVFWYLSETARQAGFMLEDISNMNHNFNTSNIAIYHKKVCNRMVYPVLGHGLILPALGMNKAAGDIADIIIEYGFISEIENRMRIKIKGHLRDLLLYLIECSNQLGFTLDEIAQGNIKKLRERVENGTLKGNGDNR